MTAVGKLSWEHLYCHALTMFHLLVLYKGEFNTVFGSILYETDELRIDNPYTRSRHTCKFSEYDDAEGMNLQDFILHKCKLMLKEHYA